MSTYSCWEKDQHEPLTRYYPAIIRFLGYEPFPPPQTLPERIGARRRELGLSIKEAARLTGVDEGTFARWESGAWKPRLSEDKVARFLQMNLTKDGG